jgi:hypothetical protein
VREGVVVYVDWEEEEEVVSAGVKGDCEKRGRRTGACFMLDFSGVLEYIIRSSKHLSVEYCFLFFYSDFCFYSFFRKAKK